MLDREFNVAMAAKTVGWLFEKDTGDPRNGVSNTCRQFLNSGALIRHQNTRGSLGMTSASLWHDRSISECVPGEFDDGLMPRRIWGVDSGSMISGTGDPASTTAKHRLTAFTLSPTAWEGKARMPGTHSFRAAWTPLAPPPAASRPPPRLRGRTWGRCEVATPSA